MISQEKTFYFQGIPITWYEIDDWIRTLKSKNPTLARTYGDPYYSESACYKIAEQIVKEIEEKIGSKYGNTFFTEKKKVVEEEPLTISRDIDWHDQQAVIKAAITAKLEKQKQEQKRQEDSIHFWKKAQQKTYTPPAPVKVKKSVNWKEILNIVNEPNITEGVIKKAFWKEAKIRHPDHGGTREKFEELMEARDLAYYSIGMTPP